MTKQLIFTFKPNGTVIADAKGFEGKNCVEKVDEIMKVLDSNANLQKREFKKEYYANVKTETRTGVQR